MKGEFTSNISLWLCVNFYMECVTDNNNGNHGNTHEMTLQICLTMYLDSYEIPGNVFVLIDTTAVV